MAKRWLNLMHVSVAHFQNWRMALGCEPQVPTLVDAEEVEEELVPFFHQDETNPELEGTWLQTCITSIVWRLMWLCRKGIYNCVWKDHHMQMLNFVYHSADFQHCKTGIRRSASDVLFDIVTALLCEMTGVARN
jgi:hypothetical protein